MLSISRPRSGRGAARALRAAPAALLLACAPEVAPAEAMPGTPCSDEGQVVCREGGGGGFAHCVAGTWLAGACQGECADARCAESACPDEFAMECTRAGLVRRCDPAVGGWTEVACPEGQACDGGGCRQRVCQPGLAFCEGDEVHLCNDLGTAEQLTETCGDGRVCHRGACLTPCGLAESEYSFVGCEYYSIDTDNTYVQELYGRRDDDELQYDVVVANPSPDQVARLTVQERDGADWVEIAAFPIDPLGVAVVPLTCTGQPGCRPDNLRRDRHVEDTGVGPGYAFRLHTDRPCIAYQFQSDDYDRAASSSGATILMPVAALDTRYHAMALPQLGTERAWLAVVATEDDTHVVVRSTAATAGGQDVPPLFPGDEYDLVLDDGDVLQIATAADGDDLTGSYVESSAPVAVFSGNECARTDQEGECSPGAGEGDHVEEQMMPIVAWGKSFVAAHTRHPQQEVLDESTWQIVAWTADTEVRFTSPSGTQGIPGDLIGNRALDAGQSVTFTTRGWPGHFLIETSEAVQIAQYTPGDVVQILVVPSEQHLARYVFLAPPFFDDTVTVTRPLASEVLLDGSGIVAQWSVAGGGFEVAWLDEVPDAAHTIEGGGGNKSFNAGIMVLGMDENCSYGYLGGLKAERINPLR